MFVCVLIFSVKNGARSVWAVYDANGDGTLDWREFASLYTVLMKKHDTVSPRPPPRPQGGSTDQQQQQPQQRQQRELEQRYAPPPPPPVSSRGSVKSTLKDSNATFESEAPAVAGGVSWGDADFEPREPGSYWSEVARSSRAVSSQAPSACISGSVLRDCSFAQGDGSGPIIAVSVLRELLVIYGSILRDCSLVIYGSILTDCV